MKLKAIALGLAAALAVTGANATEETAADAETRLEIAGVRVGNPFDPATWWDAGAHQSGGEILAINPMDPDFWMSFLDPERHTARHNTMTNPAAWGQFMDAETYVGMMDYKVWMKWVDVNSYKPLADVNTYAYWMQPGAYTHLMDTASYAQMADLDNYTAMLDVLAGTLGLSGETGATTAE